MLTSRLSGLPLEVKPGSYDHKIGKVQVRRGSAEEWFWMIFRNLDGTVWDIAEARRIAGMVQNAENDENRTETK